MSDRQPRAKQLAPDSVRLLVSLHFLGVTFLFSFFASGLSFKLLPGGI